MPFERPRKRLNWPKTKNKPGYLGGPITDTGVHDTMYEMIVTDQSMGMYKTRLEAEQAAAFYRSRKVKIVEHKKIVASLAPPNPKSKERFRIPEGKLEVPAGTLVCVYRNVETDKKGKGWVKYKLKNKRSFFECHQVTTMNQGLLNTETIKMLTSKGWMVFHTEEQDYPLIAFSAYTADFPLVAANNGIRNRIQGLNEAEVFPFHTPLTYPPHGNTFERLFNEQKNAFLFKEGFNAGARLRKEDKELDSDE